MASLCSLQDPVALDAVPLGTTADQSMTATNMGGEALTVATIGTFNGSGTFVLSGLPSLPIQLAPLQSFTFTLAYTPTGHAGGNSGQILAAWTVADPAVGPRTTADALSGT